MWLNFNKCVSRNVKCWNNKHISPTKLLRFFLSLVGLMTNIFFRHSFKRCLAEKKVYIKKKAENTRLSLQFFWASNYQWSFETLLLTIHHWIYVLSLPYTMSISFFRVKYVTTFNDTFPTYTQLLMLILYGVAVWRESEGRRKKKCVHENQELHFKMLVFIALVSWTFACGYTNVVFYMCLLYDDDDDQLVCLTFKWRHEFLPNFFL